MKKSIISLSVMLAGLFSGSAIAQTPATATCQGKTCVLTEQRCATGDSTCTRPCPKPFEGLNLTPQQQEQLKALGPCPNGKRGDKAGDKRGVCRESRKEYLAKVKGILTQEQYVQYLENCYVNAPGHKVDRAGKGHGRHGHAAKRGDRRQQQRATIQQPAVQQPTR